jgi:hypothetical protein
MILNNFFFKNKKYGGMKMKNFLLTATLLVAISATAMGVGSTRSTVLNTAVTDTLTVTANYVKPMTATLNLTDIDFGDVYTDADVDAVPVTATITGEQGETFTYTISASGTGSGDIVIGGTDTGASTVAFTGGSKVLNFTVDLDNANLDANVDIASIITVSVTYDSIDDTTETTLAI